MHKIPVNLPEVKQVVMLLQEAGTALGMGNVLHGNIDITKGYDRFTYSEDRLDYTISKPLNRVEEELLDGNCWRLADKKARQRLARQWTKWDTNLAKVQATEDEDADSESDEYGDSDTEEEAETSNRDGNCEIAQSYGPIPVGSDHCVMKSQEAKLRNLQRKARNVGAGVHYPRKKKRIGMMTVAEREFAFEKKRRDSRKSCCPGRGFELLMRGSKEMSSQD
jgi:hypothetical protein